MQSAERGLGPAWMRRRASTTGLGTWFLASLALLFAVFGDRTPAHADAKGAVLVIDANTGHTLYASAADEPRYPASLTKMMTLYMVFDLIERGRLNYQTPIRISEHAAAAAPSKLDLKEGEEIALIDAIRVLITKSANDVAIAVAEHIGGTEANFARIMTQKAHQIGMKATTFRNASGLPDPGQVTTARDMATLALRLQDEFPQHYVLFGTRTFAYKGETYRNHNTLLFHYEGTDGIKTGYTRASGFNLVSSVRRGQKHVIGVVFGGASAATRNNTMRTFLNIGLVKASTQRTRKGTPPLLARAPAPVKVAHAPPAPRVVERRPQETATLREPQRVPRVEKIADLPADKPVDQGLTMVRVRPVPVGHTRAASPPAALAPVATRAPAPRAAPPAAVKPAAAPARAVATAPSSLNAQATRLARGEPATKPLAASLAATSAAPRFHVQIGAFPSAREAERQLAAVKPRTPVLAQAKPLTQAVQQGDKTLYRARYAGLDVTTANEACNALKTQGVTCMVFKGE